MYEVRKAFVGIRCRTNLWFSVKVNKEVGYAGPQFLSKLERYCQYGFENYEGKGNWPPIKHEWEGVFRIGMKNSLFRVIGFYEDGTNRTEFIALDCYTKGGQNINAAERARIDEVARAKKKHDWRKVQDDEYPRLAKGT